MKENYKTPMTGENKRAGSTIVWVASLKYGMKQELMEDQLDKVTGSLLVSIVS
jgi:hypothetical protein